MTEEGFAPVYTGLLESGELETRASEALRRLGCCELCGRRCRADRLEGRLGVCRTGARARVASYGAHHGEEFPLRGAGGSGTIFFGRCNLRCVFCQNGEISQTDAGREMEAEELAAVMLELQARGCHNINLVSPSHVVPQVIAAVRLAAAGGLRIPLVYNSGGYDAPEALALLDGIVDIYMPDMKYGDAAAASACSGAADYVEVNRAAVVEMHRQVGDLVTDDRGIARRGLLVRHLVLPGGLSGTKEVLSFLVRRISPDTYLNLMDQYRPSYRAGGHPVLGRPLGAGEYREALRWAGELGLRRLDPENTRFL